MNHSERLIEAARKIKLILTDCDGVLTDGRLYFTESGEIMKVFHVRDGQGFALWHKAGFNSGIITGRDAEDILIKRNSELGIKYLKVRSENKLKDYADILLDSGCTDEEVVFIGDDVGDLPVMNLVGLSVAVSDAVPEVLNSANYITEKKGGEGAVREVIDLILAAKKERSM